MQKYTEPQRDHGPTVKTRVERHTDNVTVTRGELISMLLRMPGTTDDTPVVAYGDGSTEYYMNIDAVYYNNTSGEEDAAITINVTDTYDSRQH